MLIAPWGGKFFRNATLQSGWRVCDSASSRPIIRAIWNKRAVAQLGSALEWGSRGRWFESSRPDILQRVLRHLVQADTI